MESWRCHMKHSLEERMDIGRRMYLHEITYKAAMEIYGLSESCAHKYMTDYKKAQGIPLANTVPKMKNLMLKFLWSRLCILYAVSLALNKISVNILRL